MIAVGGDDLVRAHDVRPAHAGARGDDPRAGGRLDRRALGRSRPDRDGGTGDRQDLLARSRRGDGVRAERDQVRRDDARRRQERSAAHRDARQGRRARRARSRAGRATRSRMAEAQVSAARARQKSVWQQIDDTTVKAPFAGIVSDRPANLGDVVSPGTALFTIIDPSSMRLEALVPSDQIQQVQPGRACTFRVRGMTDQTFTGRIDRLSPTADPVTRQVSIFVSLPNTGGKLIAGLFAEGRVETATRQGLVVPLSAVDETGATATVTRDQGRQGRARGRGARTAAVRDRAGRGHEGPGRRRRADRRLGEGRRTGHARDGSCSSRATPQRTAMSISDFAIRRPVITVVTMLALVVFGLVSLAPAPDRRVPRRRRADRRRRGALSGRVTRQRRARDRRADRGGDRRHQRREEGHVELARRLRDDPRRVRLREGPPGSHAGDSRQDQRDPQRPARRR